MMLSYNNHVSVYKSVSYIQTQLNSVLVRLERETSNNTSFHLRYSDEIRVIAKGLKNILGMASKNSLVFNFKSPTYGRVLGFLAQVLGFKTYKGLLTALDNGCDVVITPDLISAISINGPLSILLNKDGDQVSCTERKLVAESLCLLMNWHTANLFSRINQSSNSALGELLFFNLIKTATQPFELFLGLLISSVVKELPSDEDSPIYVDFIKAPKEETLTLNNNLVCYLGGYSTLQRWVLFLHIDSCMS